MAEKSSGKQNSFPRVLLWSVVVLFTALVFRNIGLYPVVFADEYTYSKFSRLLPLADASIPGYLYLAIYRITNLCGDGFLVGARILNALFFVLSAPFVYLITRRFCTKGVASLVALLTLLGPINSYAAYFMPESLYFLSFWIFTWFILRLDNQSPAISWFIGGVLLGISALIKPHAVFLLPAILVYIVYVSRKKEGRWVLKALRSAGAFVASTFLSKFLVGYALAGKAGLTVFGPSYSAAADSVASSGPERYLELVALSAESVKGHLLAVCLLFGLPIAIAICEAINPIASKTETKHEHKMSFYALAVLFSLILVAGVFSASVANSGLYETVFRLHMRYYNFALPLLLLIAASQLSFNQSAGKFKWRIVAALPICAAILYAAYTRMDPYTPGLTDSPDLHGFTSNSIIFYVLSSMSFVTLVLWVCAARTGVKFFMYLFMPLMVIFSTLFVSNELRRRLLPTVYDTAGLFAKQYLSRDELDKSVFIGSDAAGLFRSLFHTDNPCASYMIMPGGSVFNGAETPVGKDWILVVGDHSLPTDWFKLQMHGFVLARVRDPEFNIDFRRKSNWPGIITRVHGLLPAEHWGTWSSSETVSLDFVQPLPKKFVISFVAVAFGPNIGEQFTIYAGDGAHDFMFKSRAAEGKKFEFTNSISSKTVRITIPFPATQGSDDRKLGIGLVEMSIRSIE